MTFIYIKPRILVYFNVIYVVIKLRSLNACLLIIPRAMRTRHFYELEDVDFCLRRALRTADVSGAIFWAQELLLSLEDDELHKATVKYLS